MHITVNVINHHFTNNSSVLNNKWENALSIFGRAFWYVCEHACIDLILRTMIYGFSIGMLSCAFLFRPVFFKLIILVDSGQRKSNDLLRTELRLCFSIFKQTSKSQM